MPAQRHPATDRHLFAQLEVRDRFLRAGDDHLLADDGLKITGSRLDQFGILRCLPDADVDGDLVEPRDLHDVLVVEALHERRDDVFRVVHRQPRDHLFPWSRLLLSFFAFLRGLRAFVFSCFSPPPLGFFGFSSLLGFSSAICVSLLPGFYRIV